MILSTVPCRTCKKDPTHEERPVHGEQRTRHHFRCPDGHDWAEAEQIAKAAWIWNASQRGKDRRGAGMRLG